MWQNRSIASSLDHQETTRRTEQRGGSKKVVVKWEEGGGGRYSTTMEAGRKGEGSSSSSHRHQASVHPSSRQHLRALSTETTSELDVLGLDSDTLGVNGREVGAGDGEGGRVSTNARGEKR